MKRIKALILLLFVVTIGYGQRDKYPGTITLKNMPVVTVTDTVVATLADGTLVKIAVADLPLSGGSLTPGLADVLSQDNVANDSINLTGVSGVYNLESKLTPFQVYLKYAHQTFGDYGDITIDPQTGITLKDLTLPGNQFRVNSNSLRIDNASGTNLQVDNQGISFESGGNSARVAWLGDAPSGSWDVRLPQKSGTLLVDSDIAGLTGTDLSYNATTRLLESSNGNDVTLPLGNGTDPGLLSTSLYNNIVSAYRFARTGTLNSYGNIANDFSDLDATATGIYVYFETLNGNKYFAIASANPAVNRYAGSGIYIKLDDSIGAGILLNDIVTTTVGGYVVYNASPSGAADPSSSIYLNEPFSMERFDINAGSISFTPSGGIEANNISAALQELDNEKQDNLISGSNIKTINGTSLLGPGNVIIDGSGSGGNPNIVVASNLADILSAGPGAKIELREPITLTQNEVLPANQEWWGTTGYINLNGYTLDINGLKYHTNGDNLMFDMSDPTSDFTGGVSPPDILYLSNFGAKEGGASVLNSGSIAASSTTFTIAGGYTFTSADVGRTIAIVGAGGAPDVGQPQGYVHTAIVLSVTDANNVVIDTPAVTTAVNQNWMIGYDNYNVIFQSLYMRNADIGHLIVNDGIYYSSTVLRDPAIANQPTGFVIGANGIGVKIHFRGQVRLLAHDLNQSQFFTAWYTSRSEFIGEGGGIYGDYKLKNGEPFYTSENGKGEHNHGLVASSQSIGGVIRGMDLMGFYGDGWYGNGDTQFTNDIDGINTQNGATDALWVQGNIDSSGVIDTGNVNYAYSDNLLPLTGFQWTNTESLGYQRWVSLTGGSFGAWEGMINPYFWIAFYDSNDNFVYKTPKLQWFDRIPIPSKSFTKARVIVNKIGNSHNDLVTSLRPDLNGVFWLVEHNNISYNGRQAISNPPGYTMIRFNWFYGNGGLAAGPGYGIDIEDGGRIRRNIWIISNIFRDNWGDIILRNCENVWVTDNTLEANVRDLTAAPTTDVEVGLSISLGRNVFATGNYIYYKAVGVDRQTFYQGNTQFGGRFSYTSNGSTIDGNTYWDTAISSIPGNEDRIDHPAHFKDNNHYISQPMSDYLFDDDNLSAIFENHRVIFNYVGNWETSKQRSDNSIVLNNGGLNRLFLRGNQTQDNGGYMKGLYMEGARVDISVRDYTSASGAFPITNYFGGEIHMNMEFQEGLEKDWGIYDMTINAWLELDLDQFADALSSTPPVFTMKNTTFKIEQGVYNWTNNGSNVLTTPDKNLEVYAEDVTWIIEPAFTRTNTSQKWADLNHKGKTTLIRPKWYLNDAMYPYTIDLTQTANFGANLGPVLIEDPLLDIDGDGVDEIVIITRPQDTIRWSNAARKSISRLPTASAPDNTYLIRVEHPVTGQQLKAVYPTAGGGSISLGFGLYDNGGNTELGSLSAPYRTIPLNNDELFSIGQDLLSEGPYLTVFKDMDDPASKTGFSRTGIHTTRFGTSDVIQSNFYNTISSSEFDSGVSTLMESLIQGIYSASINQVLSEGTPSSNEVVMELNNIGASQIQSFSIKPSAIVLTDQANLKGIEYAADYSANFTDRSLVDKSYVDVLNSGAWKTQGTWDPSSNTPTLPVTPDPSTYGHVYITIGTGSFLSEFYGPGDLILSTDTGWRKLDHTNSNESVDVHNDIVKGSPTGSNASSMRILGDPNQDGNYEEYDWTPPTGGGSQLLQAKITITNPTISGGLYTQEILPAAPAGTSYVIHNFGFYKGVYSTSTGTTSINVRYSGDGGNVTSTNFNLAGGGGALGGGMGVYNRPIDGDGRSVNIVLSNTTDQTLTGTAYVTIVYSIVSTTGGF